LNRYKPKNFIKSLFFRYIDDEISAMSSQLAYSLLLSFFPFLILLLTIIGYSSLKSTDVLAMLNNILPQDVFKLVKKTVIEIVDRKRGGLLSISMITTIWTASNGFNAVIRGLNKAYDEKEERPFWKVQLTSIFCTLGLALIIIIAFTLLVFGELGGKLFIKQFNYSPLLEYLIDFGRYFIGLIVMLIVFNGVYKYTPSKRLSWKETLPGAVFTTVGWTLTSIGFSYYVNHFGNYSKLYGSIGAIIALMSWLFFSSVIILIGGEINATISYRKLSLDKHKGNKY
jgi:membrane protein